MIIQAKYASLASSVTANLPGKRQGVASSAAIAADTVTISDRARRLAGQVQTGENSGIPAGEYPFQYYAMPNWMADLGMVEVTGKIGASGDELYGKGGHWVGKSDSELAEFAKLRDSHYRSLMKDEGIDSVAKHYQALIADQDNSARLQQLMKDRLAGDPRATELMARLGIAPS